jgi:Na+/H+-dicarboxylate symporter
MDDQDEKSATLNLWLAGCWIAGVVLAVFATVALNSRLAPVSDEVLKWIGQILGPICLLVLSHAFGLKIMKQFGANLKRKQVYFLTLVMSLVYIGFVIGTIIVASRVDDAGKPGADIQLHQLHILTNSGTTILVVLLWPILSMLLDYLFPKTDSPATEPDNPIS